MRFRTDDRGVTVQVGTVLLFAVLVVLISTYQATVVPQQNEQVEYNHNRQVHGELQDLRNELHRTAVTDSGGTASISLGTRFPERAFFVNPAPPAGRLRTVPAGNLTLRNAVAAGETGDYWNGSARRFATESLVYEPQYRVYTDAPTTVYDSGVLYNRFADANVTLAGQRLVSGDRISLVALNGTLSEGTTGTVSVDARPVSAATRTVTVRNRTDDGLVLVVPTDRSADEWRTLLEGELDPEGDDRDRRVESVEDVTTTGGNGAVRITLEPGTYELKLAKVGVGSAVSGVDARYVTDVRGDNESVAETTSRKLVAEVRDRYNNPVSGARVNFTLAAGAENDSLVHRGRSGDTVANVRTDSQGRAEVRYRAAATDGTRDVEVRASIAEVPNATGVFAEGAAENLTFRLTAYGIGGSGGDGGDDGDGSDGGNGTDGETPRVAFRVDDLSHVNENRLRYVTSYNVSNVNESFERVSVRYANVESPDASGTNNSTATRGNLRYGLTYATGEEWNVTVRVIYRDASGDEYVAASESITDTADALNPDGNDDLAETGSPTVESYDVTDRSNNGRGVRYRIDYRVDGNGNFDRVEGAAISLSAGGADSAVNADPNDRVDLNPEYGRGSEFRVKLLVFDGDGAVVAVRAQTDTAD